MIPTRIGLFVLVAALCVGCGIPEDQYQQDVDALKRQISALEEDQQELRSRKDAEAAAAKKRHDDAYAQLEGERARCLDALDKVGKEKGAITGDLRAAMEQLDAAKALAARQKSTIDGIVSSLKSMVSAGKLKVVRRKGRLLVEISESLLFASGQSGLKAEGKEAISELAPLLAQVGREFQVTGHTDNVGTEAGNWKLSALRANSVVAVMIESGYPPDAISAAGFGPHHPVGSNDTPEGRALNRRVEIVLVPNLDDLKVPIS